MNATHPPRVVRLAVMAALALSTHAFAAIEPRDQLKTYFETGDIPTQDQFFSLTSPTGDPTPGEAPDLMFRRGIGSTHMIFGLGGAELLTDGAGHPLYLSDGDLLRPTSGQFGTLIDSSLNLVDDRYLLGLRFTRADGVHYGYIDFSVDSPLPGWPDYFALTIHGWAYETDPNTPITAHFIPAPGAAAIFGLGVLGSATRRRR